MTTEAATATVVLKLGSASYTLRPSYDASRVLNRLAGGYLPLFRAVGNVDSDMMVLVVAAGTGAKGKTVDDLGRAMWAHGLEDLVEPLTRFLTLCSNGGRDPAAVSVKAAGDERAAPDSASEAPEKADSDNARSAGAHLLDTVQDAERRFS